MFAAGTAEAQTAGVVTLQANQTSAVGSLVPVLTWSTNPVAQSCAASGGWSGTKAASGTQTLASISASANYTLTCTWPTGSAVTGRADDQHERQRAPDHAGFKVVYGTAGRDDSVSVDDITSRSKTISLAAGTGLRGACVRGTGRICRQQRGDQGCDRRDGCAYGGHHHYGSAAAAADGWQRSGTPNTTARPRSSRARARR
jgi:hypothetical protein